MDRISSNIYRKFSKIDRISNNINRIPSNIDRISSNKSLRKVEEFYINTLHTLMTIAVVALATFSTRALPFIFFGSRQPPIILLNIEKNLPPMILLLLVIYSLKDVQWFSSPYGIPELLSVGIVAGLHFWKRNAMLSIFIGTAFYMIVVQFNAFSFIN